MKKIYLFFFLFFSIPLFGQNWSPINFGDKYIFKSYENDYLASPYVANSYQNIPTVHSIWIDSIEVINNDSVFHLNKVVKIIEDYPITHSPDDTGFLETKMIKSDDGLSYIFEDSIGNATFQIHHLASLNDSWVFNVSDNISATISQIEEQDIFGNLDSVKTIQLSSGETFKLSKNYGLFSFPNFEYNSDLDLVGIEGKNVGKQLPKFDGFYNFNIGDVFQYLEVRNYALINAPPNSPVKKEVIRKKTIIAKTVFSDSITYEYQVLEYESIFKYVGNYIEVDSENINEKTVSETYYKNNHITNSYPEQFVGPFQNVDTNLINGWHTGYIENDPASVTRDNLEVYINAENKITKKIQVEDGFLGICPDGTYNFSCSGPNYFIGVDIRFDEGLGLVEYNLSGFETGSTNYSLKGYVKNQDTIGVVFDDDDFMVANENINIENLNFTIFPNPVNELLQISFLKNITIHSHLSFYNNFGQIVFSKNINQGQTTIEIDVRKLPSGVYFLKIENEEWQSIKKVIVR
jgi:hypothetical protein